MEDLLQGRILEQRSEGAQVGKDEWIEDVVGSGGRELDEANLLAIGMQAIGFGVHGDAGLHRKIP